ncbi:MAG: hypothetical protein SFX73_12245 [Kofleriaceae bacterium]|nr:hypothetical protein [Kofleriaceae bacterium]
MRSLVVAFALAACSSSPDKPAQVEPPSAPPAARVEIASLISDDAVGVMRATGADAPIVSFLTSLQQGSAPACWTSLVGKIQAAYQIELPARTSYFVFEGDLPRPEVERCVVEAMARAVPTTVRTEGELAVFDAGQLGTTYAGWRAHAVVAGSRDQVMAALAGPKETTRWRPRLAALPAGVPIAAWRQDALLSLLFGVETSSYVFVIDKLAKPSFDARIIATYKTPADAAIAARRIKQGETHTAAAPPPALVEAFQRFQVAQDGPVVTIGFGLATFGGMSLDELQAWIANLPTSR